MRMNARLDRRRRWLLSIFLSTAACGGGNAGPTTTETFTGVFYEYGYEASFFPARHFSEASLTWTVPQGPLPVAELSFWTLGIPDRLREMTSSVTPPITLTGSGSYVSVRCFSCTGIPPVPFTLTVLEP